MKSFYASLLLCLLSFAAVAQTPKVSIVGVTLGSTTYTADVIPTAVPDQAPTILVRQETGKPTSFIHLLAYIYDEVKYQNLEPLTFASYSSDTPNRLPQGQTIPFDLVGKLPFTSVAAGRPVYLIVYAYTYYENNQVNQIAVRRFLLTPPAPLPVALVSFTGTLKDNLATLKWKTAGEKNADRFSVEMASEPDKFTPAGVVAARNAAAGGSYQFSFLTHAPLIYVRLKSIDLDGSFTYSPVVTLQDAPTGTYCLRAGRFCFDYPLAPRDTPSTFVWRNMTGQVVGTGETPAAMAPGVYIVTMVTKNLVSSTKRVLVEN
jgi:hypothetical protein